MLDKVYTAAVGPNIALVKYWGQRPRSKKPLPNNSSVSITLAGVNKPLLTVTSIMFSNRFTSDIFYIDGKAESNPKGAAKNVLDRLRRMAKTNAKALVVSYNSYPKASGMASSAAGIAALTFVAAKALGLNLSGRQLSLVAREGGSACRNVLGGVVMWKRGMSSSGNDSYSIQVAKPSYWPDLRDVICVLSSKMKKVSSSEGHQRTVKTSALYASRSAFAEKNAKSVVEAVKRRDFDSLAETTMRDSNSMHAVMLDSWPPIMYMTDTSREIMGRVQSLNQSAGHNIAAYSLDAGHNVHIITTHRHVPRVLRSLRGVKLREIIEARSGDGPSLLDKKSAALINQTEHKPIFVKNIPVFFRQVTSSRT